MRVLVVDDSTVFRKVVRDALTQEPGVEVVGVAGDGAAALRKIEALKPDLVTLDVEMPVLDGLAVLQRLQELPTAPQVIMLSAMTDRGALATTRALRLGAFDFVLKPSQASLEESCQQLRQDLLPKINALLTPDKMDAAPAAPRLRSPAPRRSPEDDLGPPKQPPAAQVVGVGVSTGGPAALTRLLPKLPADLPVPLLIVQHMPPVFTRTLADDLNKASAISVCEASHGQVVESATAYIAPGGKQMKVARLGGRTIIQVTDDPPERNCRPAVDYLFRSIAHAYGNDALAVVMTGMGDDGTLGCRLLKRNGCTIAVQDEASCVVYGMPRQVVDAGLADVVRPLESLHEVIIAAAAEGAAVCR